MTNKKQIRKKLNDYQLEQIYSRNIDVTNRSLFFMPWHPNEEMISEDRSWEVNDFTVQSILKGLYILESTSNDPITIYWMSYGGDWEAGISTYDYIKDMKSHVTMVCYGRVRSMGTVILQACDERYISKHCQFMIHYGDTGFCSTTRDFERFAATIPIINKQMEDIYLERIREKRSRFSRERLQAEMEHDNYMLPEQAVDIGLADGII